MTTVSLVLAVALALALVALVTLIDVHRRTVRNYQKREDGWANRVMHTQGFTWSAPPVDTTPLDEPPGSRVEYDHVPEPEGV